MPMNLEPLFSVFGSLWLRNSRLSRQKSIFWRTSANSKWMEPRPPGSYRGIRSVFKVRHSPGKHCMSCSISIRQFSRSLPLSLPKSPAAHQSLIPQSYSPTTSSWCSSKYEPGYGRLDQSALLRIVSWNIDFMSPGQTERASAAMDYLQSLFRDPPPSVVIMLQEICSASLSAILKHSWIRKNFAISYGDAPQRYFTLILVSKDLQPDRWFRVPLESKMERDALMIDIPISYPEKKPTDIRKLLRLCTTHLESLWEEEGEERRPGQLAQISLLLKATPTPHSEIIGGLVGGDMNHISALDNVSHKKGDVDLFDVWEDFPPPTVLPQKGLYGKDLTFGRAKGNTWGYQSSSKRNQGRLDKFFYTGAIDTEALTEVQDLTGKIGRLGVGLKTNVGVWERQSALKTLHFDTYRVGCVYKKVNVWVSDHFGITIGLRIRSAKGMRQDHGEGDTGPHF